MPLAERTEAVNDCGNNANCQDAADRAVKKVFAILGVDIDKPESVEEFRADLRFGKRMRKAADHGFLALVGLVVVGLCALVWAGIVSRINGGV
jgi:hypothetical protein